MEKKRLEMCKKLLKELKKEVGENLISFVIFGSTARGTAKEFSDMDVFILVKDKEEETFQKYLKIKRKIEGIYPPYFSSIITTPKEIKRNPLILLDIIEDGIFLYDRDNILKTYLSLLKNKLKELGAKRVWIDENTWYWDLKPDWKLGEKVEIKL